MNRMLGIALLLSLVGCSGSTSVDPAKPAPTEADVSPTTGGTGPIVFRDVADEAGVHFIACSGNDATKRFPTSLGSGTALLDYDGDGRLDLYFCTTRHLPRSVPDQSPGNRLYRNLGDWRFADVTAATGAGYRGFCHGAAVGDVNADGWPDLFLTTYGGNVLLINERGRFRDASAGSGLESADPPWSSGAAFLDYDNDGHLDLYVSRYGVWEESQPEPFCGDKAKGLRIICSPYSITPQRHALYRSRGDGTFVETTVPAGVERHDGRGLGVVSADVNLDGWPDLYVANDGCPNFLFVNNKDGTFSDVGERSGAALDESGAVQGSMGVDVQDLDGDKAPEIVVTNFRGQYTALYKNVGVGTTFQDSSAAAGIVAATRPYVGWGCALADFDNDGFIDLFTVNGEVDDNLRSFGQAIDYEQPALLWRGGGGLKFAAVANSAGPFFAERHPARGAAFGDLDDDGDLDAVVVRMDRPAALLRNESPGGGAWIRFDLRRGASEAIGARVDVFAGDRVYSRQVRGGDSYLSANDRRPLIGLGQVAEVDRVEVTWPGGARTVVERPALRATHRLEAPGGSP